MPDAKSRFDAPGYAPGFAPGYAPGFALAGALLAGALLMVLAVPLLGMMSRHNASVADARLQAHLRAEAAELLELAVHYLHQEGGVPSYLSGISGPVRMDHAGRCDQRLRRADPDFLPAGLGLPDNASGAGLAGLPGRQASWYLIHQPASSSHPHQRFWLVSCVQASRPSHRLALSVQHSGLMAGQWRVFAEAQF